MWDILSDPPEGCSIDFIRAELSSRWTLDTIQEFNTRIQHTSNTKFLELKNAGHWMVLFDDSIILFLSIILYLILNST